MINIEVNITELISTFIKGKTSEYPHKDSPTLRIPLPPCNHTSTRSGNNTTTAISPHTYASTVWLPASTRIPRRACVTSSPHVSGVSAQLCKVFLPSTVSIGTIANAPVSKTGMAAGDLTENIGPVDALIPHAPHGNDITRQLIQAAWPVLTATVTPFCWMFNVRHANGLATWQNQSKWDK